ncbi:hypothetical protein [Lentzea guizhouensis]|uniref:hypothetical protein n=1 Tax=Lentzea guizhouensis TaxID=1586287 RepID=UPI001F25A28E|nr:hypothetical protein [Lentzea guizhouensis]
MSKAISVALASARVNPSSNSRRNGPMAQEALLSFASVSSSALRPSKSRRLTSLPSVAPTRVPARVHHQDELGLGVVPRGAGQNADVGPQPHRRQHRRLGEDLRVRADPDLQVLRPQPFGLQHPLHLRGLRGPRPQVGDVPLDDRPDLLPHFLGPRGIPVGTLLDDPFEHAADERHTGGLEHLQVDRRQKPGAGTRPVRRGGQDLRK